MITFICSSWLRLIFTVKIFLHGSLITLVIHLLKHLTLFLNAKGTQCVFLITIYTVCEIPCNSTPSTYNRNEQASKQYE